MDQLKDWLKSLGVSAVEAYPVLRYTNFILIMFILLCLFICIKNKNWKVKLVTGILTFLGILLLYASIKIKYLIGI